MRSTTYSVPLILLTMLSVFAQQPPKPPANADRCRLSSCDETAVVAYFDKEMRSQGSSAEEAHDFTRAWRDWRQADVKHDTTVQERLLAKNYIQVNLGGSVVDRPVMLYILRQSKPGIALVDLTETSLSYCGNIVVIVSRRDYAKVVNGQKFSQTVRIMDVWSKQKDGWKLAANSFSPQPDVLDDRPPTIPLRP